MRNRVVWPGPKVFKISDKGVHMQEGLHNKCTCAYEGGGELNSRNFGVHVLDEYPPYSRNDRLSL